MASTEINKISSNNVVGGLESTKNSNNSILSKPYPNDSFEKSSDNNQKSETPEESFLKKHWGKVLAGVAVVGGIAALVVNRNKNAAVKAAEKIASEISEAEKKKLAEELALEYEIRRSDAFDLLGSKLYSKFSREEIRSIFEVREGISLDESCFRKAADLLLKDIAQKEKIAINNIREARIELVKHLKSLKKDPEYTQIESLNKKTTKILSTLDAQDDSDSKIRSIQKLSRMLIADKVNQLQGNKVSGLTDYLREKGVKPSEFIGTLEEIIENPEKKFWSALHEHYPQLGSLPKGSTIDSKAFHEIIRSKISPAYGEQENFIRGGGSVYDHIRSLFIEQKKIITENAEKLKNYAKYNKDNLYSRYEEHVKPHEEWQKLQALNQKLAELKQQQSDVK